MVDEQNLAKEEWVSFIEFVEHGYRRTGHIS